MDPRGGDKQIDGFIEWIELLSDNLDKKLLFTCTGACLGSHRHAECQITVLGWLRRTLRLLPDLKDDLEVPRSVRAMLFWDAVALHPVFPRLWGASLL
jgi:hypothetical protein